MARAKVRSSSAGVTLTVEVEDVERTEQAFKDVRNRIARSMRDLVAAAGEQTVLPQAQRGAAGLEIDDQPIGARLAIVKGRGNSAVLTTRFRGLRSRAVGLLEFGGTVRTEIRPKGKKALSFGGGHPVAVVRTARQYRARLFMTDAASEARDEFGADVRDRLVDVYALEGFDIH